MKYPTFKTKMPIGSDYDHTFVTYTAEHMPNKICPQCKKQTIWVWSHNLGNNPPTIACTCENSIISPRLRKRITNFMKQYQQKLEAQFTNPIQQLEL